MSVDFDIKGSVRVLNDDFLALTLNGPHADAETLRAGKYHLRFNAKNSTTYEHCRMDMVRFVAERVEPWFVTNCTAKALIASASSRQPSTVDGSTPRRRAIWSTVALPDISSSTARWRSSTLRRPGRPRLSSSASPFSASSIGVLSVHSEVAVEFVFFLRGRRVTTALFLPESWTISDTRKCQP